jgi:DNA polymerase
MIVSDIPDFRSDQCGQPFTGKAATMLKNMLKDKGIIDCYFTYIVKCRPYDGVEPTKEQIAACMPYFEKEYEKVQPKYILTLGNNALSALTKHSGIMKWRGQELAYRDSILIPTMSPAAIDRNPRNRPLFDADISLLADKINGVNHNNDDIQIHYVYDKDELKALYVH